MTARLGKPRGADQLEESADVESRQVHWFRTRRCGRDAWAFEVIRTDLFTHPYARPKVWARTYHLTAHGLWVEHDEGGAVEPAAVLSGPLVRLLRDVGVIDWERADGEAAWPVQRPAPPAPRPSWWRRFLGWSR